MTFKKKTVPTARLMRVKAAAAYLGKSPNKFREMVHAGDIPVVWEGQGQPFLVDREDLDRWIAQHKSKHPAANY